MGGLFRLKLTAVGSLFLVTATADEIQAEQASAEE
jgi:hypothetical protein